MYIQCDGTSSIYTQQVYLIDYKHERTFVFHVHQRLLHASIMLRGIKRQAAPGGMLYNGDWVITLLLYNANNTHDAYDN